MNRLPEPLHQVVAAFDNIPGIGPRAALRYAYWLLAQPREIIQRFAKSLQDLSTQIHRCDLCHQFSESSLCRICMDPKRDQTVLCIVATSQDIGIIEETGVFSGRYHVLGGTIDPIEGRTPERLMIQSLIDRLKQHPEIQEILLALNADIQGDTTCLYLQKILSYLPVRVTRLARGLPTGAQLEYADALTLADAIKRRS